MGSELWGQPIDGGFYSDSNHCYRDGDGRVIPSVTGIFDCLGLSDFSNIDPSVLEWKRGFGSAVHRGIELLVYNKLDWDTCPDEIISAVVGVESWLREVKYEPISSEEKKILTINGMRVGGTLDHRGSLLYKGLRRPCILDIKTGSKYSSTWPWQVGAYSAGAPKVEGAGYVGAALQVNKDGQVKPFWVDVLKARQEFTLLLATANLVVNAGLKKFKNQEED
jgi:hypothetical protein